MPGRTGWWQAAVAALVSLTAASAAAAAQTFDPAHRFRTLRTAHFVIYFHQNEDRLAARLATIAEETHRALERPMGVTPPALTHVVLADEAELPNGFATPLPRNIIVIYPVWPAGSEYLRTDDWLRLVFTHEFTHIVHLDRSEGWARALRHVFGRVWVAFPNLFLPTWQIEGLATFEESQLTGEGRLHAGDFRAIVDEAARARRLEPLDRVNGGLTDWPNGYAAYAYGLGFHAYLAERYGPGKLAALAAETARTPPYLAPVAFGRVFGRSLDALWRDYEAHAIASVQPRALTATRLTQHGHVVTGPRFAPARCDTCPIELVYSVRNPHEFPALYRLPLDSGAPERLATRFLGSTTGPGRETIYFDQQDLRRNAGVYGDLYALDRGSGHVRRLTHEARLADPDLSPDERTIVAVQNHAGHRDLVLIDLRPASSALPITTIAGSDDTQFNAPRWSPDGRSIAVERQILGGPPEIVVVDAATRAVRVVSPGSSTRWVTPTWRPDGLAIVAAADPDEGPFNLFEIDLSSGGVRQLTNTTGGASWPVVAPDGTAIVYAGYTVEGFDLFKIPYPPGDESPPVVSSPALRASRSPDDAIARSRDSAYSPWATLLPTSWSPVLELSSPPRLGAATAGNDVLGYHGYAATATWRLSTPKNAPAVSAAEPDWTLSYVYARWRPRVFATVSGSTSFFAGPPTDGGLPSTAALRERTLEAGVVLPISHVRATQFGLVSIVTGRDDYTLAGESFSLRRAAARGAWSFSTAHRYGYSISPEGGVAAGVTAELVRRSLGASANATAYSADGRIYIPGLGAHHVVALRVAGAASTGNRDLQRVFLVGGASPDTSLIDFGAGAMSLLRGFPANSFAGTHVALANLDYRWPIARIQRGAGVWPLFLHTVHAAVFADAAQVWTRAFTARNVKTSFGAELSADVVLGYAFPLTATAGAAWGRDGSHRLPDRTTVYVRIGRAF